MNTSNPSVQVFSFPVCYLQTQVPKYAELLRGCFNEEPNTAERMYLPIDMYT